MRIAIEGCVGSGKTTVLSILSERRPDWVFLPEPLHRFEAAPLHTGGPPVNYLKEFYDSPVDPGPFRRLQVIVSLLERYEEISRREATGEGKVFVVERSIQVARKVFIEHNRHLLSEREYSILTDLCLFGERLFETDLVRVYLKVADHEMIDRIRQRGRPSEANISFGSMLRIQKTMDAWADETTARIVSTDGLTAVEVAEKILTMFE